MRGIRSLVRRSVVVHTKDDRSLKGVLVGSYRDSLALEQAKYLDEANTIGLDGRVQVPRENVSWLQVTG